MNRRPRVAYFSPLDPEPSGIADYSEELLPILAKRWDLDLFVSGYEPVSAEASRHQVFDCAREDPIPRLADYDAVIYHVGNSECHRYIYDTLMSWPGLIVMHELAIHHLVASWTLNRGRPDLYLEEMHANHGSAGAARARRSLWGDEPAPWIEESLDFPMNRRVLSQATGVLVHSEFAAKAVHGVYPDLLVRKVDLHAPPIPTKALRSARARSHQPPCRFITAGNLTPSKRIDWVLRALARLPGEIQFHYQVVGDVQLEWDIAELAQRHGIGESIEVLGRVDRIRLYRSLLESDVGIFLRSPTLGETSAVVMRALSCGLPIVVSDTGWFGELPDDFAIKIPSEATCTEFLADRLSELAGDPERRRQMGQAAQQFAAERDVASRARDYDDFIREAGLFPIRWSGRAFQRVVERMHEMDVKWAGAAARRAAAHLLELTEWRDHRPRDDEPEDEALGRPGISPFATPRSALR